MDDSLNMLEYCPQSQKFILSKFYKFKIDMVLKNFSKVMFDAEFFADPADKDKLSPFTNDSILKIELFDNQLKEITVRVKRVNTSGVTDHPYNYDFLVIDQITMNYFTFSFEDGTSLFIKMAKSIFKMKGDQISYRAFNPFPILTIDSGKLPRAKNQFAVKAFYEGNGTHTMEFVNFVEWDRYQISTTELDVDIDYSSLDFFSGIDNIVRIPKSKFRGNLAHFDATSASAGVKFEHLSTQTEIIEFDLLEN